MPQSLARNGLIAIVTFAVLSTCDVKSTEAQGLLRRLQQRVRSRVVPPVQNTPATQPQISDPSAQRLSPVTPDSPQPDQRSSGASGSDERRPARERGRFGGSILSRPDGGQTSARETRSRPTMGIQVLPVTDGTPGLRVAGIRDGSLAKQAGLRENDLIVAIDGRPTPNIDAIREAMRGRRPGDRLRATVMRGQTTTSVTIPLLESANLTASSKVPIDGEPFDLGVEVQTPSGQRGVVLSTVQPNSAAAAAGLSEGDRIVSIDGRLILDEASFQRELAGRARGETLSINAIRGETLNTYEVLLSDRAEQAGGVADGGASSASEVASSNGGAQGSGDRPVLGGLRSVLGGLFGGSSAGDSSPNDDPSKAGAPGQASPGNASPGKTSSGANPIAASPKGNNPGGEVAQAGGSVDPLALPDDEPIDRVGFEADLTPPPRTLPADPPSIEELIPPPAQPDGESPTADAKAEDSEADNNATDELIESLREEIRRLRQRINDLESKQATSEEE